MVVCNPAKTLYALVCCFKRYYEANGVHNLDPSDAKFGSFRAVLDAEMKQLHSLGLGSTTKQTQPITPDEEASTGQLGRHSSVSLLNIVYYYKYLVCVVMMNTEI